MDFMKSVFTFVAIVIGLFSFGALSAESEGYRNTPTPDWVKKRVLDTTTPIPVDLISSGVFYRVVDDQIKVTREGEKQYYTRIAQTVANAKGLDGSSQIEIHFDPTYESLLIHDISVVRDGERVSRLESADISLFNSEQDFERRIYDGTITYNAILDDVLVGDTVDFSHSIIGSNPVYRGIFSTGRTLVWNIPVEDQYHRVLWGKSSPLYVSQRNGQTPVTKTQSDGFTDYSVHIEMVPPQQFDNQSPDWFLPRHQINYTEMPSWQAVNEWAMILYQDLGVDDSVRAIAQDIKNQTTSTEAQLAKALSYVQNNIRYVGIEIGANSHIPTPSKDTLRLKYGDCKDKSVLLLAIMRELGITGFPALVNTEIGKSLDKLPPAVTRFDHVIVNAIIDDKLLWLDPTMTDQFGPLDNLYQPDFGYALVVRENEKSLTQMNATSISNIDVMETYVIPKDIKENAQLYVESQYLGRQAQRIVSNYEEDGAASLEKQYLEYYQRAFPNAAVATPLSLVVNAENGRATLNEHYVIENAFTESEHGFEMDFYATDVRNQLTKPKVINRNAPYARSFPMDVANTIKLQFADDSWAFDNEEFSEDNPFFKYHYSATYKDKTLTLSYQYSAKKDHVPADEIEDYLAARDRARDYSSYSIIWYKRNSSTDTESSSTTENTNTFDEFAFLGYLAIALIVLFILMLIDWRLAATSRNDSEHLRFQVVPLSKFLLMGIFTFGLYCHYWVYRNWLLIEKQDNKGTWPIARGIFAPFWLYPLYCKLKQHADNESDSPSLFPTHIGILTAALYFVMYFTVNSIDAAGAVILETDVLSISIILSMLLPLPFVPYIRYINKVYSSHNQDCKNGAKIGFRHVLISAICFPFLMLSMGQLLNILPSGDVVEGSDLWSHDIAFMYRENLIEGTEQIQYFYSDAILLNQLDGNGYTDKKVFSYWIDDEVGLVSEFASYKDIKDIEVDYADDTLEVTTIKIVREDDSDFFLYVYSSTGKDNLFIDVLMSNWKTKKGNRI
ncbi:hypothetical protein KUL152_17700 [Tenacibaculum sp. KUL152]|nr:hypothetical protein KUL152_17700 [Tenacibaculum sp. KUL152]